VAGLEFEAIVELVKWLQYNNIPLDTASIKAFVNAWIENDKEESSKKSEEIWMDWDGIAYRKVRCA
jgi:hypothetical protein